MPERTSGKIPEGIPEGIAKHNLSGVSGETRRNPATTLEKYSGRNFCENLAINPGIKFKDISYRKRRKAAGKNLLRNAL